jgi:hypothetical protein
VRYYNTLLRNCNPSARVFRAKHSRMERCSQACTAAIGRSISPRPSI